MSTSMIYRCLAMIGIAVVLLAASAQPAYSMTDDVTITGTLSCAHCQGAQPKGYTQFSWAVHSVELGDGVILVAPEGVYKLQGDMNQLLKALSSKATVTGQLDGNILSVATIDRAAKNK